jgi:PTS system nitrogen regulatory IIA component
VLQELVNLIPKIEEQPTLRDTLLRALHDREQLHSTGIGDGIALPHARNALVGLVDKPVIIFGRHTTGIPYGAIDGKPAQLFFLLIAPTVTLHLAILARISRVLNNPRLRQSLLNVDRAEKALELIKEAETKLYA